MSNDVKGGMRSKVTISRSMVIMLMVFNIMKGQTYDISGVIKDESGKKVSGARLTLYSKKHQLVKTERTKALIRANTALSSGNMILFWEVLIHKI